MEYVSTKQEKINEKLAKYKKIKETIDDLEIKRLELREELGEMLESENMEKFESNYGNINVQKPYFKNEFDKEKLKEDNPFIYEKYMNKVEVKGSVRISV